MTRPTRQPPTTPGNRHLYLGVAVSFLTGGYPRQVNLGNATYRWESQASMSPGQTRDTVIWKGTSESGTYKSQGDDYERPEKDERPERQASATSGAVQHDQRPAIDAGQGERGEGTG